MKSGLFLAVCALIVVLVLAQAAGFSEAAEPMAQDGRPASVKVFLNGLSVEADYSRFVAEMGGVNVSTYVVDAEPEDTINVLYEKGDSEVSLVSMPGSRGVFSLVEEPEEKSSPLLKDRAFLESEGYLKDGKVPVIISMNTEKRSKMEARVKVRKLGVSAVAVKAEKTFSFKEAKGKVLSKLNIRTEEVPEPVLAGLGKDAGGVVREPVMRKATARESRQAASPKPKVRDLKIVDAVATEIPLEDLEKLEGMDEVRGVELDQKVHVLLDDSVPLIRGNHTWQLTDSDGNNATGRNVTIAIIDTGVDYTHPDLGGCLGSGCKVRGGYDFINLDSDPMDDHGHGTHVAGTAASNGTLKGVAPDAIIYGYKVLNSGGSGSYSQVISGVERATDPNNDGNTSDHLDILSMSLGGYGNEDSSLSLAVDEAVDAGVVSVVAAGNSGTSTNAIGTPGSSKEAVTVAATDKNDNIAYFSSRGPTSQSRVKPDLAAPGVSICASQWDSAWSSRQCYDTKHVAISGTSMATPHVSGAAALLLQLHPNWTARAVKSVLMSTSKDLNLKVWEQGAGRIDVYNASQAAVATYPQSVSFRQATENPSQTIVIENLNSSNITVNVSASIVFNDTKSTFNVSAVNVSSLTITGGANASINLSVNTSGLEGTFYGYVNITDGSFLYRVPYGFKALSQVTVNVTDQAGKPLKPIIILLHNNDLSVRKYSFPSWGTSSATFDVTSGNYTAHVLGDRSNYSLSYILTGNISVSSGSNAQLNLSLNGTRRFNITAYALDGTSLDMDKLQFGLKDTGGGRRFSTSMTYLGFGSRFQGDRLFRISDTENVSSLDTYLSISYIGYPHRNRSRASYESTYTWASDSFNAADEMYYMGWILNGSNSSTKTNLNYTASDLGIYNHTYGYPGTSPQQGANFDAYNAINFWISSQMSFDASSWHLFAAPMERASYILGDGFGYWHYMYMNYLRNSTLGGDWRSEFAAAVGQKEDDINKVTAWPRGVRFTVGGGENRKTYYGYTPYEPTFFDSTSGLLRLNNYMLRGYGNGTYMYKSATVGWWSSTGESGSVSLPKPNLKIYSSGSLIVNTSPGWLGYSYSLPTGNYTVNVTIPSGYPIMNNTFIEANFTMSGDLNPPNLFNLTVLPRFVVNRNLSVRFNFTDDNGLSSVAAYYSLDGGPWFNANASAQSSIYIANINVTNSSADHLLLRLTAHDVNGNSVNYTFVPIAMKAHNVSLGLSASSTSVEQGDIIRFSGNVTDAENSRTLPVVRLLYYINDTYYEHDRAGYYRWPGYTYSEGYFDFKWKVPASYSGTSANITAHFNGTGVYLPINETVQLLVNVSVYMPTYSNVVRSPASPDANDDVKVNSTWVSSVYSMDTVLLESNYSGTWTNYTATASGSVYNYTIQGSSLSANTDVYYRFLANNTNGDWNTLMSNQSFRVAEISANLTAGQTYVGANVSQNNTLWCDYVEVGSSDVTSATVNASIDSANQTMSYNSTSGRYEYVYNVTGSGTKSWNCYANKTDYQSLSTSSSFAIQAETTIPMYSSVTRTSDPVYNDMDVQVNTTWTDNAGISYVILQSNYTGSWVNYTVAAGPSIPYIASHNISYGNFSVGDEVAWRYIANDTSGNWNTLMPNQSFTVQNRNPWITFTDRDSGRGWGENWTINCTAGDLDGQAVNTYLWSRESGGSWVLEDTYNVSSASAGQNYSEVVNFTSQYFNTSNIGSTEVKCNVSDAGGLTAETSVYTVTVEKDNVTITVSMGNNDTVHRYGNFRITLGVSIYDSDKGEYVNNLSGRIYWTRDGSTPYDADDSCVTNSSGVCNISLNPDSTYEVGPQYFLGGTLPTDTYYEVANSSAGSFKIMGTLFASVDSPSGIFNRGSVAYLNTTVTDDTNNNVSADSVSLGYKHSWTADWKFCTPVNELTGGMYYCALNTSNLTLGLYDIRYSATKDNYTSLNSTVFHQFRVIRFIRYSRRFNFTNGTRIVVNATEVNVSLEIIPKANVTDAFVNVTFNSTNPKRVNMSVPELGKFLEINASSGFMDNFSYILVKMNYTDEEVNNSGLVEATLRIWFYNTTLGNWTKIDNPDGGVDTEENYVWANLTHLSDYGIGGQKGVNSSCTSDSECESGNCASDYDGSGSWCAPVGNCAHDYDTGTENGDAVCNGDYREVCFSGSWTEDYCSRGCSSGTCLAAATTTTGGGGGGGAAVTVSAKRTSSRAQTVSGLQDEGIVRGVIDTDAALRGEVVRIAGPLTEAGLNEIVQKTAGVAAQVPVIIRKLTTGTGKSTLSLTMSYQGSEIVRDFLVYDSVPKSFASSSGMITVVAPGATVNVVESDPVYSFLYPNLVPGQGIEINYTVNSDVSSSVLNETANPVILSLEKAAEKPPEVPTRPEEPAGEKPTVPVERPELPTDAWLIVIIVAVVLIVAAFALGFEFKKIYRFFRLHRIRAYGPA